MSTHAQWMPRPGLVSPKPDSWLTRLFDYKPFLIFICLAPALGLLVVFLTYPLGLGSICRLPTPRLPARRVGGLENFKKNI